MSQSVIAYLILLVFVGLVRLVELRISARNQRGMKEKGVSKVSEPGYRWMVALHIAVLISAGLEVIFLHRPLILPLAVVCIAVLAFSILLRWWVIRTLASHWNVQVMASTSMGVVTGGPYKWVRHPNYLAVFLELLAIPLIYSAWITAIWGTLAHIAILRSRIHVEEAMLMSSPQYRAAMGSKPRFLPGLF
jgi:methyltransferase